MTLNSFLMPNDDNSYEFFVKDALISILRAWTSIDCTQPETLATFDSLTKEAQQRGTDLFSIALEQEMLLTTPVIALCVGNALYSWKDASPHFAGFRQWLRTLWKDEDTADSRLLDLVIDVLDSISQAEQDKPSPELLTQLNEKLRQTATELDQREKREDAFACAMSAINFAGAVSPSDGEAACSFALSLAKRDKNQSAIFMLLSQRAHFLARIAANDPSRRLEVFDAVETALGHVPSDPTQNGAMLKLLEGWINQEDYLHVLRPMLLLVSGSDKLSNSVHREGVAAAVNTIWSGTLPEWLEHFNYVQGLSIETANTRTALMPKPKDSIKTVWNTWTIEHNRLRRAIPHGTSIKREKLLHVVLLEISHEVTHVFSMFGFVGVALTAMRLALMEAELDVWGRIYYRQGRVFEDGFRVTPAPLKDADLISFGYAERAAEIERRSNWWKTRGRRGSRAWPCSAS